MKIKTQLIGNKKGLKIRSGNRQNRLNQASGQNYLQKVERQDKFWMKLKTKLKNIWKKNEMNMIVINKGII